jgi:protein TonB
MRTYTLLFSIVVHVAVVAALLAAPLLASDLPDPLRMRQVTFFAVVAPPEPPPAPPSAVRRDDIVEHRSDAAPLEPPDALVPEAIVDRPSDPGAIVEGGVSFDAIVGSVPGAPIAPPPVPAKRTPVRVGGAIRMPEKTVDVPPVYPRVAIEARIQGVVILEAVLDEQGAVRDVRVLRSIPLLDHAAADAVRQWRYLPTLLNGQPVPVVLTVTVTFTLDR